MKMPIAQIILTVYVALRLSLVQRLYIPFKATTYFAWPNS